MPLTVLIESGLHAGAVQRLEPGIYTIGSELDADIVLSDPDVAALHVILEFDDQLGLRIEPAKGSVSIEGETVLLEPGGERSLGLPARFNIGATTISIRAPQDVVKNRQRKRMIFGATGAATLGIVGLYVIGALGGSSPTMPETTGALASVGESSLPPASQQTQPIETAIETANAPASEPAPVVTVDMAAAQLRDRLATASLETINVIVKPDHVVAKGSAEPEQMDDWQDVQMWFDGAYGRDVPLVPNVEMATKVEPPKLAIEAVWSGENPYLMAGGRRYFEGTAIGDGWTVEQIGIDEIRLRRGDQSFSIAL